MSNGVELKELWNHNKVFIQTGLSTGQMIDQLKVGDEAVYQQSDKQNELLLVVSKKPSGAIVIAKNGEHREYIGQELILNARVMSYAWTIYRPIVSFYDAMKSHEKEKKTITYHHDEEQKYTFKHELTTDQFNGLYHDSLCLYELIEGKWTIDD
jgi:hypothetical protein